MSAEAPMQSEEQSLFISDFTFLKYSTSKDKRQIIQSAFDEALESGSRSCSLPSEEHLPAALAAAEYVFNQLEHLQCEEVCRKEFLFVVLPALRTELEQTRDPRIRLPYLESLERNEWVTSFLLGHEEDYYGSQKSFNAAQYITAGLHQKRLAVSSEQNRAVSEVVLQSRWKDERPKVSVIVPVYNGASFLEETLACLSSQTLDEIEIVCIDDGSADNSLEKAQAAAECDQRITVLHQSNHGQSRARNIALQYATGDYIYFMDADDLLDEDALRQLYAKASKGKLDMLFFDADTFFESDELRKKFSSFANRYQRTSCYPEGIPGLEMVVAQQKAGEYLQSPCLFITSRNLLNQSGIRFIEGVQHEDNAFTFALALCAQRASHLNAPLYHRRIREDSTMTGAVTFKRVYGYFACYEFMIPYAGKALSCLDPEDRGALMNIVSQVLRDAQKAYAKMDKSLRGSELALGFDYASFRIAVIGPARDIIEQHRLDGEVGLSRSKVKDLRQKVARVREKNATLQEKLQERRRIAQDQKQKLADAQQRISVLEKAEAAHLSNRLRRAGGRVRRRVLKLGAPKATQATATAATEKQLARKAVRNLSARFIDTEPFERMSEDAYPNELASWYESQTEKPLPLQNPQSFNEKIQWLKLFDNSPLRTMLSDRLFARRYVADRIGEEHLVPLIGAWNEFGDIPLESLPDQFVLKATHGKGMTEVVLDKPHWNSATAKKRFGKWLRENYAFADGFELQYRDINPKIIAEAILDDSPEGIPCYGVVCFHGNPYAIWADTGCGTDDTRRSVYALNWEQQNTTAQYPPADNPLPKPAKLDSMLEYARSISQDFPFMKVNFFEVDGEVYFSSVDFSPESGVLCWSSPQADEEYGSLITLPVPKETE